MGWLLNKSKAKAPKKGYQLESGKMKLSIGALNEPASKTGTVIFNAQLPGQLCSVEVGIAKGGAILFLAYRTGDPLREVFEITYTDAAIGQRVLIDRLGEVTFRMSGPVCHELGRETIIDRLVSYEEMASIMQQRIASVLAAVVDREIGS